MKLYNLLKDDTGLLKAVKLNCQEFIEVSNDLPLIKWCSSHYADVHKVKVRKRKTDDEFTQMFNSAFTKDYPSLINRSIVINPEQEANGSEQFYIFPTDGFKFIYNTEIVNSRRQLTDTLEEINQNMPDGGSNIITDVLSLTYQNTNLSKAIMDNVEIIVYNIPVFYAVRTNVEYSVLLEILKDG